MSQWHLDALHKALTQAGWRIVAQHPGDEHKISATWEIQRSTKSSTLFIDFEGFDDMREARTALWEATNSRVVE